MDKTLKFNLDGDIRRVPVRLPLAEGLLAHFGQVAPLPEAQTAFEAVECTARLAYGDLAPEEMILYYMDSEDDLCLMNAATMPDFLQQTAASTGPVKLILGMGEMGWDERCWRKGCAGKGKRGIKCKGKGACKSMGLDAEKGCQKGERWWKGKHRWWKGALCSGCMAQVADAGECEDENKCEGKNSDGLADSTEAAAHGWPEGGTCKAKGKAKGKHKCKGKGKGKAMGKWAAWSTSCCHCGTDLGAIDSALDDDDGAVSDASWANASTCAVTGQKE
eukprot:NODE_8713_length_1474_cov_9.431329.p2 GENE.NODE_8713_length_1474_cov_9.431329~~NODE_8713_length_1474_cov_9.431329.p2  ORF type:complete len:276 (-),score=82.42 NODE_8713_length_1474_cov_9.431329:572-1399(-)